MATGWRAFNDLDLMQDIGRGEIAVDLLAHTVSLDGSLEATFSIAAELMSWFDGRRRQDRVPEELIREAVVTISFETYDERDHSLWIRSVSRLRTDEAIYAGSGELGRRPIAR